MDPSVYGGDKAQDVSQKICLDPSPEKAVDDYYRTKYEGSVVKKKPEWDVARLTPATELVAARRELVTADNALANKREEQAKKREELDAEWEELAAKEKKLKEFFQRFNKFVKENHEKRERAQAKIEEELATQQKRDAEIEALKDKVEFMKNIKTQMELRVQEYKIYENFLFQVIESSSDKNINSPFDVLNRYETLASARADLAARQEKDLQDLEQARTDMIKLTEDKSQVMMGLNNELADLQIRYDKSKAMALRWETAVNRIKNISAEKALELDQVRISCWNLYTAMCVRKGVEVTLEQDNIEEQLVFIKRTIQELKRIYKIVVKKVAKEISSSKPESTSPRVAP